MPFELEYLHWGAATLLFLALATPVVLLGIRSLTGVGRVRKWVSIGLRLAVLLLTVLILAGIRIRRTATDLQVMVLRDVSPSIRNVTDYPGQTVQSAVDHYVTSAASVATRPPNDKLGLISFDSSALVDQLPSADPTAVTPNGAIHQGGSGTDIASAIQLGLVTFGKDAMRRLVLISDGNPTTGETDRAVALAAAQHVPIDVVPLHYDIKHEVLMDRLQAPTWRRENEPFTLSIVLKNTNDTPAGGTLTVTDQGTPIDLDPGTPGVQPTRRVVIPAGTPEKPGLAVEAVKVPPRSPGVHQWHARFDPDTPATGVGVASTNGAPGAAVEDTLDTNNGADAFTYVKGKGRLLFVDNVPDGGSAPLLRALQGQGIEIDPQDLVSPEQMPGSLLALQQYDAVVLDNVPYGPGGLSEEQQRNLATYVHDMGGGLVMIGGPDSFGAGGWQGKKLEEVLPVNMDIPATRQIPKGALVLAMDPAEMGADGNYWGVQCAIKAVDTLSAQDDVGLISYGMHGYTWDYPLGPKGDGSRVIAAAKSWWLGDLPSFEEVVNMALDGDGHSKGLIADDAAQKHIIIITDDDPQMPTQATLERCRRAKISISTVTVYPHVPHNVAPGTREAARYTGGRSFGPIEDHPDQLPQIFIKEATVVRRSLISENAQGIPLTRRPTGSDVMKGIGQNLPAVSGLVLTSKKNSPQVQVPITAGASADPLLATWQTGLGKVAVYTSDATNKWGVRWIASPDYDKFWSQMVRSVARPPMSNKFDVSVNQQGDKGHLVVEAADSDTGFADFLDVNGPVIGPTGNKTDLHLVQTGPGRYEATFDMPDVGTYVSVLQYRTPTGEVGNLPVGGISQNTNAEMRDLHSNDALLEDIAARTGGRVLPAFDAEGANLFTRENLAPAVSRLPVWDRLIPVLLALILIDVAARRIAWDWAAVKGYAQSVATFIRSFTTVTRAETNTSLGALQRIRSGEAGTAAGATGEAKAAPPPLVKPDPRAKFVAKGVEGDIANVVGGATAKPVPSAPKKPQPKGITPAPGSSMSSLMEAKRRAQQKIDEKSQG
jgi:uncharacterized membrane protein